MGTKIAKVAQNCVKVKVSAAASSLHADEKFRFLFSLHPLYAFTRSQQYSRFQHTSLTTKIVQKVQKLSKKTSKTLLKVVNVIFDSLYTN